MEYIVLDERIGYIKENQLTYVLKGDVIPQEALDSGQFTDIGLAYLITKGRIKAKTNTVPDPKPTRKSLDSMNKDDLIALAVEKGLGAGRDLVSLKKSEIINLLEGKPSKTNKLDKDIQTK
jgi:hypothetical protein